MDASGRCGKGQLRGLALQPVAATGLTPRVEVQRIDNNQWVDILVEAKSLASNKGAAIVYLTGTGQKLAKAS